MRIKSAFFVGMLTLAYATCLPQPASATCNPSEFTDRIYLWDGSTGSNPPSKALPTPMIEDLGDAYCYAPDDFRGQLLSVDYVFIDATNCMNHDPGSCSTLLPSQSQNVSWGERRGWGYTDIGIPAGLWPQQQHAGKYADAESDVLNGLIQWQSGGNKVSFASGSPGSPLNRSWMTVLAALAHEVGHARWFTMNARNGVGQRYDFKRLNDCGFFIGWNSTQTNDLSPKGRWRNFGDRTNEGSNDHKNDPKFGGFDPSLGDQTRAQNLVTLLTGDQPWVTYLGANSPDEDFVETYKFSVLFRAGLTSMQLTIPAAPGTKPDVPADFAKNSKTTLANKVKCLTNLR